MDFCTYFYKNKALFGGFPHQDQVDELIQENVTIFLDLTTPEDKLTRYLITSPCIYINYPIPDGSIPENNILKLLLTLRDYLLEGKSIYVHCKGGHGRSGMIASAILCLVEDISPYDSIKQVTLSHRSRKNLKSKWLTKLCPHQRNQQQWIYNNFGKTVITFNNNYNFFNLFYTHNINIDGKIITNLLNLFLFYTNDQVEFKEDLSLLFKNLRKRYSVNYLNYVMHRAYSYLIRSHKYLQEILIGTGLKRIYYISNTDSYWGFNKNIGSNYIGKILECIRSEYITA